MNNLEKEFVPYEEVLALKELGFDELCFGYWYTEQEILKKVDIQSVNSDFIKDEEDYILAPTFSQAFRWFREKYKWFSSIEYSTTKQTDFVITINKVSINDARDEEYKTYEEAELACLKKLIEIAKINKP